MNVLGCYQFRVTRNSDLFVDEEEVKNLRSALQGELPQRHFGDAVRLEVADNCPQAMADFLLQQFDLRRGRPLPRQRPGQPGAPDAASPTRSTARTSSSRPSRPGVPARAARSGATCSRRMRKGDMLLHHPFQSFTPVIDFIQQAAARPEGGRDQADGVPHRHRLGADAER